MQCSRIVSCQFYRQGITEYYPKSAKENVEGCQPQDRGTLHYPGFRHGLIKIWVHINIGIQTPKSIGSSEGNE